MRCTLYTYLITKQKNRKKSCACEKVIPETKLCTAQVVQIYLHGNTATKSNTQVYQYSLQSMLHLDIVIKKPKNNLPQVEILLLFTSKDLQLL